MAKKAPIHLFFQGPVQWLSYALDGSLMSSSRSQGISIDLTLSRLNLLLRGRTISSTLADKVNWP